MRKINDKEKSELTMNSKLSKIGINMFMILILTASAIFVFTIKPASAVGEVFVCAEKTTSGAWCQNVPENQVDTRFRKAPTSCESTSFCKVGTCVDSQRGQCRPNVPQRVCQQSNGVWIEGKPDSIQQCQVGCCLVGDQASFVTQTGCRGIASDYGIETNFRADIKDFAQCLSLSNPQEKGACVIDDGFQRDCKVMTKGECNNLETSSSEEKTVEFSEGLLCTAEVLATRCSIPSADKVKTTCISGKYGVYFVDSCGNVANVYDASKVNDREYWTNIKEISESCSPDSSNAGSRTCGNCDYLSGSVCKPVERGNEATPQPQYGDFVCADLSCKYKGEKYKHGEEWCGDSPGTEKNLPGSEYYSLTCYNGEVTVNACDSFRQTVCVQGESNDGYRTAVCIANKWRDCVDQTSEKDCKNTDKRDCKWVEGASLLGDGQGYFVLNSDGNLVPKKNTTGTTEAACVPKYAPGFQFWANESGTSESSDTGGTELCLIANANCVVTFEKESVFDSDWECKENCGCLEPEWVKGRMDLCLALGDCGVKTNFIGAKGYHNDGFVSVSGPYVPDYKDEDIKSKLRI